MHKLSQELKDNIKDQRDRVEGKKGSIIVISGQTGEGKTTLGVQIAEEYIQKNIDFETQLAMGGNDFLEKRDSCLDTKAGVLIYDEAGDLIAKRSMSKFNVDMVRDFELQRVFKLFVILCLPSFRSLESSFYTERGLVRAVCQVQNRNDKRGEFLWYGRRKIGHMIKIMSNKNKCPDLIDDLFNPNSRYYVEPDTEGLFYDLPPERSAELEKYSLGGKAKILTERNLKENGYLNYKDISQKTGYDVGSIRNTISKQGIEPYSKVGRVAYFSPDVLDLFNKEGDKE